MSSSRCSPIAPKYQVERGCWTDQRAARDNRIHDLVKSAKPPSPVQIRAAPPILNLINTVTCGNRGFQRSRGFETVRDSYHEQSLFDRFDGTAVRGIHDVCIDPECRGNTGVSELLLRDLRRHAQVVEQRRVNVAGLMPRQSPQTPPHPDPPRSRLQDSLEQLRLAERLTFRVAEHEVVQPSTDRHLTMPFQYG